MNLNSLKTFLTSLLETIMERITSSHIYNSLLERYQSLDISHQKWIKNGFIILSLFLVFYFPFYLFTKSVDFKKEVQIKKELIYLLLKKDSNLLQVISTPELKTQIETILNSLNMPGQIQTNPLPPTVKVPTKFSGLKYTGQQITIQNLNIKQALEIGTQLEQISPFTKVIQFKIEESSENENYFTTTYSLIHFQNPNPPEIKPLPQRALKRKGAS